MTPGSSSHSLGLTAERAVRLYRLLQLLASGPQSRDALRRRLRIDLRTFYRDLELLRGSGIKVPLRKGHYILADDEAVALARLPFFPDPPLTFAEAQELAKGRSAAHRKLGKQLQRLVGK